MRSKFLNVLTVCLVTLAVLSPEIVIIGVVWGRHLELLQTQELVTPTHNSIISDRALILQEQSTDVDENQDVRKLADVDIIQEMLSTSEQYKIANFLQWFFLIFPISVGLGIILYDRYVVYRAAVLREKVQMLEKLWQQSIEQ